MVSKIPLLKSPADIGKLPFGTFLNHLEIGKGLIRYSGRFVSDEQPRQSDCFWGWMVTKPKEVAFPEHREHRQYHLPFTENTKVDGLEIVQIGFEEACINWFDCMAASVPVQFNDGSFGIVEVSFNGAGSSSFWLRGFDGPAAKVVRQSKTMPKVRYGIGSGVKHFRVSDREGRPMLVKTYFNDKAGRADEVYRT